MRIFQKTAIFIYLLILVALAVLASGLNRQSAANEKFGHVEKAGNGPITLILVPCLGCDWTSFDTFMERNAGRYTMYAITWPGMGDTALPEIQESDSLTPYYDYITQALVNLIHEEGLEKPVILGHSAAAPAVIKFAYEYPDLIAKAISVDAIITNKDTLGFSMKQRLAWADAEFAEVIENYDNDAAWTKLNTATVKTLGERAGFYTEMWRTPPRQNVFAYWLDWLRVDAGKMVAELSVPVLGIYAIRPGTEDPEAVKNERGERIDANTCGSPFEAVFIEDSYHTIWESNPEGFDRALAESLSE